MWITIACVIWVECLYSRHCFKFDAVRMPYMWLMPYGHCLKCPIVMWVPPPLPPLLLLLWEHSPDAIGAPPLFTSSSSSISDFKKCFKISISPVCRVIWVFRGGGVGLVFPHCITRKICFKASVLHNTQCALYIAQYIYITQNIVYTHMCPWKSTLHRKHLGCSLTKKREHVENTILYYLCTLHSIAWHCIGGGWVGLEVAEQTALDNEAKYLARRRLPGFLDQIHILPTHHTSKHIRLHPPTPFSPKLRPLAYKYVCKKLTFFIFCVFPLFTRGWGGT